MSAEKNWQFELEEQRTDGTEVENDTKEADIVSARIEKLLGEKAFRFSPAEWLTIRRFKVKNDAFEKNSWHFRNALVRANYNDLQNGIHATTKFLEMFFSNLILGTEYDLKNRYMHVDYVDDNSQSVTPKVPKSQFDTLECTLEELAVLELIYKNPSIKQKDLVAETGKSLSTVKRIMESLQKKEYIRRVDGKRYGKWEILV